MHVRRHRLKFSFTIYSLVAACSFTNFIAKYQCPKFGYKDLHMFFLKKGRTLVQIYDREYFVGYTCDSVLYTKLGYTNDSDFKKGIFECLPMLYWHLKD